MKTLFTSLLSTLCLFSAFAQQSVTIDPKANSNPIVNIQSTTKGQVMARMTVAQRNIMSGLIQGTQVYCTDCTPAGAYFFDGGSWQAMFQTTTVSPTTYTVGQAAQGGIVFWIDPASGGQHGLVAATTDMIVPETFATTSKWHYNSTNTEITYGAFSFGMYGGGVNTQRFLSRASNIIAELSQTAIGRATAYNGGTYGDWHLPSINELELMYTLRATIGGFANATYWSSTERYYFDEAYYVNFTTGGTGYFVKTNQSKIRAIRRF